MNKNFSHLLIRLSVRWIPNWPFCLHRKLARRLGINPLPGRVLGLDPESAFWPGRGEFMHRFST
jgi:hypothetical protein